jgi:hypothetical protein
MKQQPVISTRMPSPCGKRIEETARRPGRMVVCLGTMPNAPVIERYFQERGWKVQAAASGAQARQFVRECCEPVVLLAEESNEESGWLTCWKVLSDQPNARVCVIGPRPAEEGARLAKLVKAAAYIPESESAAEIALALRKTQILN